MIYSMEKELLCRATGRGSKRQSLQNVMRSWVTRSIITRDGSLLIHLIRLKKEGTRRQQSISVEQEQKKSKHKLNTQEEEHQNRQT
ncbi:unnamed protein product [Schistosoma margrebowiei]|uniref:Uncharacterized protein n=1 Tax=Schistosoma margrebowiei TaxID=48269 RepID=A0A183M532_9TREM|nr:unnamed protein product [Schistosoma margrebowiei]